MKRINAAAVPSAPPTDVSNGFNIWESPVTGGIRIVVQSLREPGEAMETILRPNAISSSTQQARQSLMRTLERQKNSGA